MQIQVKQEHIDKGVQGKCGSCPIALAINENLVDGVISNVRYSRVDLVKNEVYLAEELWLPPEASRFIRSFDNGEQVQPFSFELEIPAEHRR